ncbi:MAG: glutathione S-transferase N-terminal domain-containing protein [Gammaproteobacteria bacterium]
MSGWEHYLGQSPSRRSGMTLYCAHGSPLGHVLRILLAEKDVPVEVVEVDDERRPEDLNDLNPYAGALTLIDRDLVLYEFQAMLEYLDERYPHPPLMPVDPVSRANHRQLRYRILRDLYGQVDAIVARDARVAANARTALRDYLTAISPAFAQKRWFLSDEYTLADCCMGPLLWRLGELGVGLPQQARPLQQYADRLFARPSFRSSLLAAERQMYVR